MNNKKFMKRGPQGALFLFLYEVTIVVLIDFIAILTDFIAILTPGIFLIQICIKFIFIVKILKCIFPKVGYLNFNFILRIHYTSQRDEINCNGISKAFSIEFYSLIFKNE